MVSGDFEAAAARYEQMIDAYRPHKDREMMVSYSWALGSLGECRRRAGDADGARTCFKEALAVAVPYGIFTWLPEALHGIADIAAPSAPWRAAVLLGAAQAFRTETGLAGDPATFAQIEECVSRRLTPEEFEAAHAEGASRSTEEAAIFALETLETMPSSEP